MTNLLLLPVAQSVEQGRRIMKLVARTAAPLAGSVRSTARSTMWFAPSLVAGSAEQLVALMPDVVTRQLPARTADVDHLEARVAGLEAAAAAKSPAPAPKRSTSTTRRPRTANTARGGAKKR